MIPLLATIEALPLWAWGALFFFITAMRAAAAQPSPRVPGLSVLLCLASLLANPVRIAAADIPSAGTMTASTFQSAALGEALSYWIYLPAVYATSPAARFPVLYLLHGRGDSMEAWRTIQPDLDRLIAAHEIPPVIAVLPDAPSNHRAGYYVDSSFSGGRRVETAFTTDLVRHVDTTYRTQPDRAGRIVAGYSMGGYGALRFSLAHPELFHAAIVLSPAVYFPLPPRDSSTREFGAFGRGNLGFDDDIYREKNYPALLPSFVATRLPLVMFIAVGDDEHALADPAEAVHDLDYEAHTLYNKVRRAPGITAQLRVVDGGHNWATWRPTFLEGVRYVFQQVKPHD